MEMMRYVMAMLCLVIMNVCYGAQQEEHLVSLKSEVLTKNVFRGEVLNNDPVAASTLGLNKKVAGADFGLDIKIINDLTAENDNNAGDVSELDVGLHTTKKVYDDANGKFFNEVTAFGGVELFTYHSTDRDTTAEIYAGFDTMSKKLYGVHTRTTIHYDFVEADGFYIDSRIYRPIAVPLNFAFGKQEFKSVLTPEAWMGWGSEGYNQYYWDSTGSATTDWGSALKLVFESKNFEFGPSITYTDLVGHNMQDFQDDNSSNWIYGFMIGGKF